jgi:hypothetical protein
MTTAIQIIEAWAESKTFLFREWQDGMNIFLEADFYKVF